MYFDNCHSIEDLDCAKDNIIHNIEIEYNKKLKELLLLNKTKKTTSLIKKARDYVDTNNWFEAYPIRQERGKRSEVIFHEDGTVTI